MVFDTNILENSLPHPVSSSEIAYLLGWPHSQPRDCGLNKKCLEAAKKKNAQKVRVAHGRFMRDPHFAISNVYSTYLNRQIPHDVKYETGSVFD